MNNSFGKLWAIIIFAKRFRKLIKKIYIAQNIFSGFIKNYILSSDLLINILGHHRNSLLECLLNIRYVCTWHCTMYRGYICKEEGNLSSNGLVTHYLFMYIYFFVPFELPSLTCSNKHKVQHCSTLFSLII